MKKPGGKLPLPPVFARRSATPALRRAFFHAPHFRHGPGRKSGFNISKNLRAQRFPGNITRTQLFRYTVLPKGMLGGKRTASPAPARSGNIIPWRKTSYAKRRKPRAARKNGREERQGRRNAGRKARERTARGQERGNGRRREQEEGETEPGRTSGEGKDAGKKRTPAPHTALPSRKSDDNADAPLPHQNAKARTITGTGFLHLPPCPAGNFRRHPFQSGLF